MDPVSVKEVLSSLKNKNSEGYDRIPQRILVDGADFLVRSFEGLFERIYYQKTVPGQWLVSKNIPIFKNKGDKNDIENYRPISNLSPRQKYLKSSYLKEYSLTNCSSRCAVDSYLFKFFLNKYV